MTNPPGAGTFYQISSTGRAEDLGMGSLSSLAAHECSEAALFLTPWLPSGAPCSSCTAHSVFCELSGQDFSDSNCEELVSIFPRQS